MTMKIPILRARRFGADNEQPNSDIANRRTRIMGWALGAPKSSETTVSVGDLAYDGQESKMPRPLMTSVQLPDPMVEAASQPVHEMFDPSTSPPVELPTAYCHPLPSPTPEVHGYGTTSALPDVKGLLGPTASDAAVDDVTELSTILTHPLSFESLVLRWTNLKSEEVDLQVS